MEKKMNNEELQSRREFFKKAAKAALPVVGAIVLANMPIQQMKATASMSCPSACKDSCAYNCTGCSSSCEGTCRTTCSGTCHNACTGGCKYQSKN